jgi:hypothetical protein
MKNILIILAATAALSSPLQAKQLTGNIQKDFNLGKPATTASANPADAINNLMTSLSKLNADVVTNVVADIQAADADAGTVVIPATATTPATVNDPIAHACYPAAIQFLQTLPVIKPTTGTLVGVQLFQKKRDFIITLKAGLPAYLKIGCGALLGDEVQTFVSLMGMVGITVATGGLAGLFPAATLLPALPALTIP